MENSEDNRDINKAWDTIRENIKISFNGVSATVNQSIINRGLMKNIQNWLIEGSSRLKYSGCRTQLY
jgi:hypothetical protein